jgi:very-short-patch-repair endonuclease
MPTSSPAAISLLEHQHALIARFQLGNFDGGLALLRRMLRTGSWVRVDPGLYGPAGVPMTWHRRLMAAAILAPSGALISHRALAHLMGVGGFDTAPDPEISIPAGTTFRRAGVVVHESSDLALAAPRCIDGIPCSGPARLAMDLGSVVSEKRYRQTVRELRHDHGVTSDALLRTYLRHKRQGRNGGGALRDWLGRYFEVDGVPESGLEQLVLDAILDACVRSPVAQHWVRVGGASYRLDLAYPDRRICIEVDGIQHRDDPDVRAADLVRQQALEDAGWTVIRIRSWCFASDLAAALRQLRGHLVDR